MNYKCKEGFQSISLNGYCYKSTVIDDNKYKSLRSWEQLYFNAMYETPSATFEIPVISANDFLADYKPELDYDHHAEQEMDDTMRRAAEDYERQLIENFKF